MRAGVGRTRPVVGLSVALAVVTAGCGPRDEPNAMALCDSVDDLVAVAVGLGEDPDEITDDYRRLADGYERIAEEVEDPEDAEQARRLARVVATAADDIDDIDLRDEVDRLTEESAAVAEMSETINANLPIGLGPGAMEQIEEQCDPDFRGLIPSGG